MTGVSATPSQGTYSFATGAWTVGTVTPSIAQTLTITATASSPIPSTNTAAISHSDQFDPNTANNSASVNITPANIHDFDGDGKSDVLWYNNANGQAVAWLVGSARV